eukprot:9497725-Pyramimonas_sp.AAC.1
MAECSHTGPTRAPMLPDLDVSVLDEPEAAGQERERRVRGIALETNFHASATTNVSRVLKTKTRVDGGRIFPGR